MPTQSEAFSPPGDPHGEAPRDAPWSQWAPAGGTPWTVGIEEEVMLLDPVDWSLASRADTVISRLTGELASHTSTETHGSALELRTDPHQTVAEGLEQLEDLRDELVRELAPLNLRAAAAGLHPFASWQDTKISEGDRYRFLYGSMRELARREPTFALHVHVAVPDPKARCSRSTGYAPICRRCSPCRPTPPSGRVVRRGWPRHGLRCSRPFRGSASRVPSSTTKTT